MYPCVLKITRCYTHNNAGDDHGVASDVAAQFTRPSGKWQELPPPVDRLPLNV